MELVAACPAVVCCRCSPEQKAQVVRLIQQHTGKRTAAVGKSLVFIALSRPAVGRSGIKITKSRMCTYLQGDEKCASVRLSSRQPNDQNE